MVCSGRPYHLNFFKGCLPHILLGPFLYTLSHIEDRLREADAYSKRRQASEIVNGSSLF